VHTLRSLGNEPRGEIGPEKPYLPFSPTPHGKRGPAPFRKEEFPARSFMDLHEKNNKKLMKSGILFDGV
jgi:hypothetical protein